MMNQSLKLHNVNNFINSSIDGNADDSAITEDEIRIAIKDLRNNKASGIDEIINEYLKSTVSSYGAFVC
jgi:hypothetical protein